MRLKNGTKLKTLYKEQVIPKLIEQFDYKNVHPQFQN